MGFYVKDLQQNPAALGKVVSTPVVTLKVGLLQCYSDLLRLVGNTGE